ncbi:hypothetical protein LCGC14_2625210, partial [marine sediment metagenome]
ILNRYEENIMGLFGTLFKPKGDTIKGTLSGVGELAKNLRTAITGDIPAELRADLLGKVLDIINGISQIQSNIIIAEAQGASWLQRNWRPITMMTFLVLVCLDSFGVLPFRLAKEAWTLLSIGLGGYVVGRSAEKVVGMLKK